MPISFPAPEGADKNGAEKLQDPVRIQSEASISADEVATVQEAGLVAEELRNEEADGVG